MALVLVGAARQYTATISSARRVLTVSSSRLKSSSNGSRQDLFRASDLSVDNRIPDETDIVIIGGGALGMSTAYWLKQLGTDNRSITIVERDFTYSRAATALSVGSIRQQFSLPENILMSLFSVDFLRKIKSNLSVLGYDPPDVNFNQHGYLFLASENGRKTLEENHKVQRNSNTVRNLHLWGQETAGVYLQVFIVHIRCGIAMVCSLGAKLELLSGSKLKDKYPWMNTDGIALASHGVDNEGWFDPWLLLSALKMKASSIGVNLISGSAIGFESTGGVLDSLVFSSIGADKRRQVRSLRFKQCVDCCGPWSREVARMAGIGTGVGPLAVDVPVEPRKRYVYTFHCPSGPGNAMPMLIDSSGVYVRREGTGGHYICGSSPPEGTPEPDISSLDVDYEFFNTHIWPILAHRIPAFEAIKLKSAWAGYYDYNYFDQNLIIGMHPQISNFYLATGCSGHGIQHSPAIGRAMAELLTTGNFSSIDLSRLSFERVLAGNPMFESNIV